MRCCVQCSLLITGIWYALGNMCSIFVSFYVDRTKPSKRTSLCFHPDLACGEIDSCPVAVCRFSSSKLLITL